MIRRDALYFIGTCGASNERLQRRVYAKSSAALAGPKRVERFQTIEMAALLNELHERPLGACNLVSYDAA